MIWLNWDYSVTSTTYDQTYFSHGQLFFGLLMLLDNNHVFLIQQLLIIWPSSSSKNRFYFISFRMLLLLLFSSFYLCAWTKHIIHPTCQSSFNDFWQNQTETKWQISVRNVVLRVIAPGSPSIEDKVEVD